MDLGKLRDEIDVIDREVARLFERRMEICQDVAEFKIETGKAVFDPVREQEKIEAIGNLVQDEFNRQGMQEILSEMMAISRKRQYKLLVEKGVAEPIGFTPVKELHTKGTRVVYSGVEGAYAYEATKRFFGEDVEMLAAPNFDAAISAIDEHMAEFAVLPIENSSAGAVGNVYDLLIEHENYTVGELDLPISHCLLGLPDAELSDIVEVQSHAQALQQCRHFLAEHSGWQTVSTANTAASARAVAAEGRMNQAAIASEAAGRLYGLKVLAKGINREKENTTRFIIITKKKIFLEDASKVRICFECRHQKGTLYHLLSHFAYNGLNMMRIESRPIPGRNWEYRFFIDFEGNLQDATVRNALKGIQEEATFSRILGNC